MGMTGGSFLGDNAGDYAGYDTPRAPQFKDAVNQVRRGMPNMVALEKDYAPQLNQMQYDQMARFAPMYNELTNKMTEAQRGSDLGAVRSWGGKYKAAMEDANPTETAMKAELGKQIGDDLKLGGDIGGDLGREMTQGIRAGQSARGMTQGNAPVTAEALGRGSLSQSLKGQRQNDASSYMNMPHFDAFNAVLGRSAQQQVEGSQGNFGNRGQGLGGMVGNVLGQSSNNWATKAKIGNANNAASNNRNYQNWEFDNEKTPISLLSKGWGMVSPLAGGFMSGMGSGMGSSAWGSMSSGGGGAGGGSGGGFTPYVDSWGDTHIGHPG